MKQQLMSRSLKMVAVVVCAILFAALSVAYYVVDPATSNYVPKCLFKSLTGFDCPGCGSQRMLHALLHGDIASAWQSNPFLLVMLPMIGVMILAAATRRRWPRFYAAVNSPAMIAVLFFLLIGWSILRNIIF